MKNLYKMTSQHDYRGSEASMEAVKSVPRIFAFNTSKLLNAHTRLLGKAYEANSPISTSNTPLSASHSSLSASHGTFVDAHGTFVDARRTFVDARGTFVDARGTFVDAHGTACTHTDCFVPRNDGARNSRQSVAQVRQSHVALVRPPEERSNLHEELITTKFNQIINN
jgi:hypothetical protein